MGKQLILRQSDGREIPISEQPLYIGRGPQNDWVVEDPQVSRRHAMVRLGQGTAIIRDEGSTNGTFINGRRIAFEEPLRLGDDVRIGRTHFEVVEDVHDKTVAFSSDELNMLMAQSGSRTDNRPWVSVAVLAMAFLSIAWILVLILISSLLRFTPDVSAFSVLHLSTRTATVTVTLAPTVTAMASATVTATMTPSPTPTLKPTQTETATPTPTSTSMPTSTPTSTQAPPTNPPPPSRASAIPPGMGAFVVTNHFGRMEFYLTINSKTYTVKTGGPQQTVTIFLPPGHYTFSLSFPSTYVIRCEKVNSCTVDIREGEYTYMPIY